MRKVHISTAVQPQATSKHLMIRPLSFGFNAETGQSNAFQHKVSTLQDPEAAAREEFDDMVANLTTAGVEITVVEDRADVASPDAVFSNNWVSFHQSGKVVLYPMMAENRRRERRMDIIDSLRGKYHVEEIIDLSYFEKEGKFLEGTGSMVFDRRHKIAYTALSPRTHIEPLMAFSEAMGYEIVHFDASDENGQPLYHTNVMMCVGDGFAVVCLNALKNEDERYNLRKILEETDKQVIEIFPEQLSAFAGNMLMVRNSQDQKMMVMSSAALHSLTTQQKDMLEEFTTRLLYVDLSVIEALGGGSARCMMTEIHLPEN